MEIWEKIGLTGTALAPCKDEEVSLGSTFLVGIMDSLASFDCYCKTHSVNIFPQWSNV